MAPTTTSSIHGHIRQLNNSAVQALAEGQLLTATAHLDQALQDFHRILGLEEGLVPLTSTSEESKTPLSDIQAVPIHPKLCVNDHICSPENVFPICNAAFWMPANLNREEVAVVLLYNAGLAALRKGIMHGKDSLLRKSFQFQSMVLAVLQDEAFEKTHGYFHLLRLALWTNQGFLHAYWCDYDAVLQCKEQVKYWMHHYPSTMPVMHLSFFQQTVFLIDFFGVPQKVSPAA